MKYETVTLFIENLGILDVTYIHEGVDASVCHQTAFFMQPFTQL